MLFPDILGHQSIKEGIIHAMSIGRMHHAMLFVGRSGVGKSLMARALAQLIFCEESEIGAGIERVRRCRSCRACRRVESNQHPDFIEISTQTSSISIDSIRELQQRVAFQPFEAKHRVVIIHDAHLMLEAAANSLLKTLEEPTTRSFFILITDQITRLLPTIISRCQLFSFAPFSAPEVQDFLIKRGFAPEKAEPISALSGGSFGEALELCEGNYGERILDFFGEIISIKSPLQSFSIAEALSKDKEIHRSLLLILEIFFRDLMLIKSNSDAKLMLKHRESQMREISAQANIEGIANCIKRIEQINEALIGNAHALLSFEHLLLGFRGVLYPNA